MAKINAFDKLEKLTYIMPASPLVLVATKDKNGAPNVAPIALFSMASSHPPKILVCVSPKARTVKNIMDTGEFVVAIPAPSILQKAYDAQMKAADGENKIAKAGLTAYDGVRIAEAIANFVCRVDWTKESGNHVVVCADVVAADMDGELYSPDMAELRRNFSRIYHLTDNKFLVDGEEVETEK